AQDFGECIHFVLWTRSKTEFYSNKGNRGQTPILSVISFTSMRKTPLICFCIALGALATRVALPQGPPAAQLPVIRKTVQTTDGKSLTGRVIGEGLMDLQLATDDGRVQLLRKADTRYRVVTSQKDWPSYHGDMDGNHYTTATLITKSNVSRLAARW